MTSWAFNLLMGHRSEEVSHKLNKVKDARVNRWTSMSHAKQVVGHACIKGALTIFFRCKKYVRRFHVVPDEEKGHL